MTDDLCAVRAPDDGPGPDHGDPDVVAVAVEASAWRRDSLAAMAGDRLEKVVVAMASAFHRELASATPVRGEGFHYLGVALDELRCRHRGPVADPTERRVIGHAAALHDRLSPGSLDRAGPGVDGAYAALGSALRQLAAEALPVTRLEAPAPGPSPDIGF